MSNMKGSITCPICGEPLQKFGEVDPDAGTSVCMGANCPKCGIGNSDIKLWQAFICARKVLGIANKALQELKDVIACPPDMSYEDCVSTYADGVLQEITTALLDYKEPVVTHNKIEFPEHNDGLLEEFDKQFFEDGQDDDLTETALEQKDEDE